MCLFTYGPPPPKGFNQSIYDVIVVTSSRQRCARQLRPTMTSREASKGFQRNQSHKYKKDSPDPINWNFKSTSVSTTSLVPVRLSQFWAKRIIFTSTNIWHLKKNFGKMIFFRPNPIKKIHCKYSLGYNESLLFGWKLSLDFNQLIIMLKGAC